MNIKETIKRIPVLGSAAQLAYRSVTGRGGSGRTSFPGSSTYWDCRYDSGGDSGVGSYGRFAHFKAEIINSFVREHAIESVIEFGCGDGNQLELAEYPRYLGVDVSPTAINLCECRFRDDPTKAFVLPGGWDRQQADLALSLDVIFHLVEDDVFGRYMSDLFGAARRFVIIYASNYDETESGAAHVRHRNFSRWIEENALDWQLHAHIPNRYSYEGDDNTGSFSDFYIYARVSSRNDVQKHRASKSDRSRVLCS